MNNIKIFQGQSLSYPLLTSIGAPGNAAIKYLDAMAYGIRSTTKGNGPVVLIGAGTSGTAIASWFMSRNPSFFRFMQVRKIDDSNGRSHRLSVEMPIKDYNTETTRFVIIDDHVDSGATVDHILEYIESYCDRRGTVAFNAENLDLFALSENKTEDYPGSWDYHKIKIKNWYK